MLPFSILHQLVCLEVTQIEYSPRKNEGGG